MGYIYALDFPSGKSYIGLTTKTPEIRYLAHQRATKYSSLLVHRAWKKYGAPVMRVLVKVADHHLPFYETRAIQIFGTLSPGGYNLGPGGEISPMKNPEVSQKVAAKLRGRPGIFTGLVHTEEAKAKQRAAKLGKKLTEEHKSKIAAAGVGRIPTAETRAKLSASNSGKPKSQEHRKKLADALTLPDISIEESELIGYGTNGRRLYSVCKYGHPLSGDNLSLQQEGKYIKRRCKQCMRDRMRAQREKRNNPWPHS